MFFRSWLVCVVVWYVCVLVCPNVYFSLSSFPPPTPLSILLLLCPFFYIPTLVFLFFPFVDFLQINLVSQREPVKQVMPPIRETCLRVCCHSRAHTVSSSSPNELGDFCFLISIHTYSHHPLLCVCERENVGNACVCVLIVVCLVCIFVLFKI